MALTYNLKAIPPETYKKFCTDGEHMSKLTEDIIFATQHVNISQIRNKGDAKKFIARFAMWHKAWGDPKEQWYPFSVEQVSAHIGMYTNASNLSHDEFLEKIKDIKKRRANPAKRNKKAAKKNPGKAVRRRPQPRDLLGWEDHAPSSWTPYYQKKIGGRVWEVEMDGGCDPDETDNEDSPYSAIASDGQGNRTWFGYVTGDCDYKRLLRGLEKQIRKLMGMERGRARTMSAWREWTGIHFRRRSAKLGTSKKGARLADNPKAAKKKVPWSARDIKGMQEFADRKLGTKKKTAKKKAARKKTPPWQLLINRCQKLWDHYCERPSKSRLKPVLEHLEKMKGSTSKKVADERKRCQRVANKEAKRLKMK